MEVQATGDGFDGLTLHGRVLSFGAQAVSSEAYGGSSSYKVIVAIDPLPPEQQQRVRLGMSAKLAVVTYRAEHGLAVPAEALRYNEDGSIYVIHRTTLDQPPRKITVTPGKAVPQGVEVSGLEQGFVELPER